MTFKEEKLMVLNTLWNRDIEDGGLLILDTSGHYSTSQTRTRDFLSQALDEQKARILEIVDAMHCEDCVAKAKAAITNL